MSNLNKLNAARFRWMQPSDTRLSEGYVKDAPWTTCYINRTESSTPAFGRSRLVDDDADYCRSDKASSYTHICSRKTY